jgi:hypothetical protein
VLPSQLRGGDPASHLPAVCPTPLLDRPDHRVLPADHIQPFDQLGHRQHPATGVSAGSDRPIRTRRRATRDL